MPLFSKRFKAQATDYGAEFIPASTGAQQTITAAATIQFPMLNISDRLDTDKTKKHVGYIDEVYVFSMAAAAGSLGITLTVKKRDVAGASTRTLISNYDLKALTAQEGKRVPFDAAVTDKDRTMQAGDTLWAEVVCAGTVTTQPILTVSALIALLK